MIIVGRKPAENETVWIYIEDGKCHINCMIYDRTGWHLGWWSGSCWHSYMDKTMKDGDVKGWLPLKLPEIEKIRELESMGQ